MATQPVLKKNYKCDPAVQLFYTGGPVAVAPDFNFLACACTDEVKVVDAATGSVRTTLEGDSEPITAIAITPDGKALFAASRSRQVKLWDLSSGTCTRSWKAHEGPIADMVMDPSGRLLATAGTDRAIFVWDADKAYCTHAFRGHGGIVTTVKFHPDQKRLLLFSGGDDATIRVWDLVKKKCIAVLEKHFSTVTSLDVSISKNCLLTAGRDKVVNVWNLQDFSFQTTIPVFESLEALCVVPNGSELMNVCDQKKLEKVKKNDSDPVCFLTAGERGIVRLWLAEGAVCLYEQKEIAGTVGLGEEERRGFVGAVLMPSADGVMCITADQRLLFYNASKSDSHLKISKRLIGYNEEVIDLKFMPGEKNLLAVATNLEQIRIYDMNTTTCTQELFGHKDIVLCLDACLSPTEKMILASGGKDHMIRIWDVVSGTCLAVAEGHMAAVGALAFSRKSNKFLVSGSSDHTLKVWSLEGFEDGFDKGTIKTLSSLSTVAAHDKDINSIAVAPNDSLLCSGSQDRTARIWKLPELIPGLVLRGHKRGIWSVQFSPVDQCVLTASGDKTIRLWALTDGSCLKTFEGHTASVLRASFLSRGTQIVSAGADGLLKLWTIKTNECINTFDQHENKIWALDVNGKDEMLATGGGDSVINIWNDCTKDDEEDARMKEEEETLKEQDLSNALANTDYKKAVQLAFELKRPFKLLSVFTELFRLDKTNFHLYTILKGMDKEHIQLLLSYIREWNTKPKFCHIAQRVLSELFHVFPPNTFLEVSGLREMIEGILPYTERHFSRVDRLLRSAFLLDYTLSSMSVLNPLEPDISNLPVVENGNQNFVTKTAIQDVDGNDKMDTQNLTSRNNGTGNEPALKKMDTPKKRKKSALNNEINHVVEDGLRTPPTDSKRKKTERKQAGNVSSIENGTSILSETESKKKTKQKKTSSIQL